MGGRLVVLRERSYGREAHLIADHLPKQAAFRPASRPLYQGRVTELRRSPGRLTEKGQRMAAAKGFDEFLPLGSLKESPQRSDCGWVLAKLKRWN